MCLHAQNCAWFGFSPDPHNGFSPKFHWLIIFFLKGVITQNMNTVCDNILSAPQILYNTFNLRNTQKIICVYTIHLWMMWMKWLHTSYKSTIQAFIIGLFILLSLILGFWHPNRLTFYQPDTDDNIHWVDIKKNNKSHSFCFKI